VLDTLGAGMAEGLAGEYLGSWLAAQEDAEAEIEAELDGPLCAGQVHRAIEKLVTDGEIVYTASSMAIRDQERFLSGCPSDVLYLANRGANGIDGLIASGAGAAAATGRATTVITGDLGFQHDVGSLAVVAACPNLRIVVINDGGGRIFFRLPQRRYLDKNEFDYLMKTPGDLDISAAAASFGLAYERVEDLSELSRVFAGGSNVIEIPIAP
jgi:2-succinyl-5-enolpyruvyl-6-hydroxy-3-cyclohexene-1-carboxylate synthase